MYISIKAVVSKENFNEMERYCIYSNFFQQIYLLKYNQIYDIKLDCINHVFTL